MSKNFSDLLDLLVEESYGELSKVIFSTLQRKGQLTLHGIAEDSGLHTRHVKRALAILIQGRQVCHHIDRNSITSYEANPLCTYALVRIGKAAATITDRFGEDACRAVELVIQNGFISIGRLKKMLIADTEAKLEASNQTNGNEIGATPGVNGDTNGSRPRLSRSEGLTKTIDQDTKRAIYRLLKFQHLTSTTHRHFMSNTDLHVEAEHELLTQPRFSGGPRGNKAKAEFATDLYALKRKWVDDEDEVEHQSSKRKKISNGNSNGVNGHSLLAFDGYGELDDDLVVKLNQEKVALTIRTERLVDLAARHVSHIASQVYEGLLLALEDRMSRCYDEFNATLHDVESELKDALYSISSQEILCKLDPELDLSRDLPSAYHTEIDSEFDAADNDIQQDEANAKTEQIRLRYLECHMLILCADPRGFAYQMHTSKGNFWRVRFRDLSQYLIQQEIEDTTIARWGSKAKRLLRVLHQRGRLEDKQIAELAIMRIREVRLILRAMQEKHFVGIQEVPKDNARHPSRTIFLWFFDQDRVRRTLLDDTYMFMSRLLQRRLVEQAAVQPLIDKLKLVSVGDDITKIFSKEAIAALREWEFKEEKILLQLNRLDDTVAILRDFLPERI